MRGGGAASTASYDLHDKLLAHRRNSVREYIVLLTEEPKVLWHEWPKGTHALLETGGVGILRSETFPGLWQDPVALPEGRLANVLDVLRRGGFPEHAGPVKRRMEIFMLGRGRLEYPQDRILRETLKLPVPTDHGAVPPWPPSWVTRIRHPLSGGAT